MKTREDKAEILKEIEETLNRAKGVLFLNLLNLPNSTQHTIKQTLKKNSGMMKVFKRTFLAKINPNLPTDYKKPLALVFDFSENLTAIRSLKNLNFPLEFLGGWIDERLVNQSEVSSYIKLSSKEELIAKLLYLLKSPIQKLTSIQMLLSLKLVKTLESIGQSKQS